MKLYLIQHGLAYSAEEDPQRALNPEGNSECRKTARALKGRLEGPLPITHSSKLRARQTAMILAETLGEGFIPEERTGLAPGDSPAALLEELESASEDRMIVGHLPYLPRLLSALLDLPEQNCPVAFRNSAVLCLERRNEGWKIIWYLSSELL